MSKTTLELVADGALISRIEHFRYVAGIDSLSAAANILLQMGLLVKKQENDHSRVTPLNELTLVNAYNSADSLGKMAIMDVVNSVTRQPSSCRFPSAINSSGEHDSIHLDELADLIDRYLAANEDVRQCIRAYISDSTKEFYSVKDASGMSNDNLP